MAKFSQKQGSKEVGQASVYAKPHDMSGKMININNVGIKPKMLPREQEWTPMHGVSIPNEQLTNPLGIKSDGITVRGCGAATKGTKARGPMA